LNPFKGAKYMAVPANNIPPVTVNGYIHRFDFDATHLRTYGYWKCAACSAELREYTIKHAANCPLNATITDIFHCRTCPQMIYVFGPNETSKFSHIPVKDIAAVKLSQLFKRRQAQHRGTPQEGQ
jgi:ferredoxin-thioredoxin reductase catalytic subunit